MLISARTPPIERGCILFDHLVGEREQLIGNGQAEHPGSLGVDDQLELGRLHHRQVRRLGALEDATGIDADLTKCIRLLP